MKRVVASVEARMASSRLPGKVLADIEGLPMIGRLIGRLSAAKRLDAIVLATTDDTSDDRLADWAARNRVDLFRGSSEDVLARVVGAQEKMKSDIVVEICGDTPFIDPAVVDRAVDLFLESGADVVTTTVRPSFPQGCDVQVFSLDALRDVSTSVFDPAVREHVSLHFYENPSKYAIASLDAPPECRLPDQRLQVDYPEDLELARQLVRRLEPAYGPNFSVAQIVGLLRVEPELRRINAACVERSVR